MAKTKSAPDTAPVKTATVAEFEAGVRLACKRIFDALDERIINAKYGGSPIADTLINAKRFLPTADLILADHEKTQT